MTTGGGEVAGAFREAPQEKAQAPSRCGRVGRIQGEDDSQGDFRIQGHLLGEEQRPVVVDPLVAAHPVHNRPRQLSARRFQNTYTLRIHDVSPPVRQQEAPVASTEQTLFFPCCLA